MNHLDDRSPGALLTLLIAVFLALSTVVSLPADSAEGRCGAAENATPDEVVVACREALSRDPQSLRAAYRLARAHDNAGDVARAAPIYRRLSDAGHAPSTNSLARLLLLGLGVEKDTQAALRLFRRAAEAGHVPAQYNMGYLSASDDYGRENLPVAVFWYRKAADQGYARAQYRLGRLYQYGSGVERDHARAAELYAAAADQGYAPAQYRLGLLYDSGSGVATDDARAARLYRSAADQGNVASMRRLGRLYRWGEGVPFDTLKAYVWYRLAEKNGDRFSLLALSELAQQQLSITEPGLSEGDDNATSADEPSLYSDEDKIAADEFLSQHPDMVLSATDRTMRQRFHEAAGWLEKAVQAGLDDAVLRSGNLQLRGDSVVSAPANLDFVTERAGEAAGPEPSARLAAAFYREAVESGSVAARINLATLYELGHGLDEDLDQAAALYREALGGTFDAPARIGLLRLEFAKIWSRLSARFDALADRLESSAGANASDITLTALDDFVPFKVTDRYGRRYYSGGLKRGELIVLPKSAEGRILWIDKRFDVPLADVVALRVDESEIRLPPGNAGTGLRLNRQALLKNADYVLSGPDDFRVHPETVPEDVRSGSRIVLVMKSRAAVYVHGESDLIGFQESLSAGDRFLVPDIPGLFLEMRPEGYGERDPAIATVMVDGESKFDIVAPLECLTTLSLDADALASAARRSGVPQDCADRPRDKPISHVVAANGSVLGEISVPPDTSIPGLSDDAFEITRNLFVMMLRLGGRWDEYLDALKIVYDDHLRDNGPNSFETIETALSIAELEADLGDPGRARTRIDEALERLDVIGTIPDDTRAGFYLRMQTVLSKLGRHGESEKFQYLAAAYLARHNFQNGRPPLEGFSSIYGTLADLSARLGRIDEAIAFNLRQQLLSATSTPQRNENYTSETGPGPTIQLVKWLNITGQNALVQTLLPELHQQAKREAGARDLPEPLRFPLDLSVFENVSGPVERSELIAGALGDLGQVYSWMGRHREALPLLEQKAATFSNIYGSTSPQATAALAELSNVLRLNGDSAEALDKASEAWEAAVTYVDSRGNDPQEAVAASVETLKPAGMALLVALEAQDGGEAAKRSFEVAQRLQNSATAVAMRALGSRLGEADGESREFLRRRQDISEMLVRLDRDLVGVMSGSDIADRKRREAAIRRQIAEKERLVRAMDAAPPEGVAALDELSRPAPVSAGEAARLLREDEALVVYLMDETDAYAWTVTRAEGIHWTRLPVSGYRLGRLVRAFRTSLDPRSGVRGAVPAGGRDAAGTLEQLSMAHRLYEALVAPVAGRIKDRQTLLIAANGALTSLPFHALVAEVPDAADTAAFRKAEWLVRRHAISVMPSVASLKILRQQAGVSRAPRAFAGFGDPVLGSPGSRLPADPVDRDQAAYEEVALVGPRGLSGYFRGGLADTKALATLDPLPDTAGEIRAVAGSLNAGAQDIAIRLGPDATETALKAMRLSQFRIVHFATHGLVSGELEGLAEPALVMTPPQEPSARDDGLLTASEIAQLRLNADWVILSACNTAGGETPGAEALSGLARAFFHAGARAALVSHWPVVSSAAVELTTRTFGAMAGDPAIGRAQALRRAMLELIDEGEPYQARPVYWAPFVIVGEGGAI